MGTDQTKKANFSPEELRSQAIKDILTVGGVGLGVGAASRGIYGLLNMLNRSHRGPEKIRPTGYLPTRFPLQREEEEEPKAASEMPTKQAFDPLAWLKSLAKGEKATSKSGIPWYPAGMVGAGVGGLYGGYKGVDHLLDERRRKAHEDELEQARQEFHAALASRYGKTA